MKDIEHQLITAYKRFRREQHCYIDFVGRNIYLLEVCVAARIGHRLPTGRTRVWLTGRLSLEGVVVSLQWKTDVDHYGRSPLCISWHQEEHPVVKLCHRRNPFKLDNGHLLQTTLKDFSLLTWKSSTAYCTTHCVRKWSYKRHSEVKWLSAVNKRQENACQRHFGNNHCVYCWFQRTDSFSTTWCHSALDRTWPEATRSQLPKMLVMS